MHCNFKNIVTETRIITLNFCYKPLEYERKLIFEANNLQAKTIATDDKYIGQLTQKNNTNSKWYVEWNV